MCLVGLIGLVLAPSIARADTLDNQLAQLRPIAVQWWTEQGLTATRCDTVEFSRHDYGSNDSTLATTLEGTDLVHPQWPNERVPVCHVVFAERLTQQTPAMVCIVVLHEWGHILGLDHSLDQTNIMYGGLLSPPSVCALWGAPPVKGLAASGLMHAHRASRGRARHAAAMLRQR